MNKSKETNQKSKTKQEKDPKSEKKAETKSEKKVEEKTEKTSASGNTDNKVSRRSLPGTLTFLTMKPFRIRQPPTYAHTHSKL